MKLILILVSLALALALPAAAQTSAPTAQGFLEQLFARYRGGREVPYNDDAAMRTVFSPRLRDAMRRVTATAKPDEVPCLNGDPIVSGQEISVTDVRIRVEPSGQGQARGTASFRNAGQPRNMRYSLVQSGGNWLIDDISSRDMPSLRAFLAAC